MKALYYILSLVVILNIKAPLYASEKDPRCDVSGQPLVERRFQTKPVPLDLYAERNQARADYIKDYLQVDVTTPKQNRAFKDMTEKWGTTIPGANYAVFDVAAMKWLNDNFYDKNFVTALANRGKQIFYQIYVAALKQEPMGVYSDFKSVRTVAKITEKKLRELYILSIMQLADELHDRNLIRKEDRPEEWFQAAFAKTADQANVTARISRDLSGGPRMRKFTDPEAQENLKTALQYAEISRKVLAERFSRNMHMIELNDAGLTVPHSRLMELLRQHKTPEQFTLAVKRIFGFDITAEDIEHLHVYIKLINIFSPDLYIEEREKANLNDAQAGGFTIDYTGMGIRNQIALAKALAGELNIEKAIEKARASEQQVTNEFKRQKNELRQILSRNSSFTIKETGDDFVVSYKDHELSWIEKQNLLESLVNNNTNFTIRLAFVRADVPLESRMTIATHGEKIEKTLRTLLAAEDISRSLRNKLSETLFAVDMQTTELHTGNVLLLSAIRDDQQFTSEEQKFIYQFFVKAVAQVNAELEVIIRNENGNEIVVPASYTPVP